MTTKKPAAKPAAKTAAKSAAKPAAKKAAAAAPTLFTRANITALIERGLQGPVIEPPEGGLVVAVLNEKGGVGKTTIATHFAVMCAAIGWDTLLMDVDHQMSATKWANVRNDYGTKPMIPCVSRLGKVGADIVTMANKFDVVVVDSGGRDSLEMRQAIAVADVMLMPVSPGQYDIWSLGSMDAAVKEVEERAGSELAPGIAFLNDCGASKNDRLNRETFEAMQGLERFKVSENTVVRRTAFGLAAGRGRSVFEVERIDAKACEELAAIFKDAIGIDFPISAVA